MAVPLIVAGLAAAAKIAAKNYAKDLAKKTVTKNVVQAKPVRFPGQPIKINTNPVTVVKPAIFLGSRSTGGITGVGAKSVTSEFKNMGTVTKIPKSPTIKINSGNTRAK